MQHFSPVMFAPVFPAMKFHVVRLHIAVQVGGGPGGGADAIGVEARVKLARIFAIQFMDLGVKPVNFLLFVYIIWGFWPVVVQPGELRGVHECGNGHGVGGVGMVFLGQVRDIPAEAVEALHDPVSGVALHQVIIPHDKDDVDRFVRGEKVTVKSESMKEGVHASARDSDVVCMHRVTFIL